MPTSDASTGFVIQIGDGYWRRRYNSWSGNRGTLDDCATFKTLAGAEKRAEGLRDYCSRTNQKDLAKTIQAIPRLKTASTIAQMQEDAAVAAARTDARKPWADKVLALTTALSEAATNLTQAAYTLRTHGLHEKAAMYDADAQAARSVLERVSNRIADDAHVGRI